MSNEKNTATLTELFENLGPGFDAWFAAYKNALSDDCTWWMQGWPLVAGMEELKAQVKMLRGVLGAYSNPILEWRSIDSYNDGDVIYFERRGSFADEKGETIVDWDIKGVFHFNAEGKIHTIRDYFDNSSIYETVNGLPKEQVAAINAAGRASHPLGEQRSETDPNFYRNMLQQMSTQTT